MRRIWISGVLSLAAAALMSGQSIVESATAAAGGSAAGAAGKTVSDGLDAVFGKVGGVVKTASGGKPRKATPAVPPLPTVRLTGQQPAPEAEPKTRVKAPAAVVRRQANLQASPKTTVTVDPEIPGESLTPPAPPAPVEPSIADLSGLSAGTSREDVLRKMGKPASRITMSEDHNLVEVYKFRNREGDLGSVRMVNGQVSEVKPVR